MQAFETAINACSDRPDLTETSLQRLLRVITADDCAASPAIIAARPELRTYLDEFSAEQTGGRNRRESRSQNIERTILENCVSRPEPADLLVTGEEEITRLLRSLNRTVTRTQETLQQLPEVQDGLTSLRDRMHAITSR